MKQHPNMQMTLNSSLSSQQHKQEKLITSGYQSPQNQNLEPIGQKFTNLLLTKALEKESDVPLHFRGSTNEVIFKLSNAAKGSINEEAYEEAFGIKRDRSIVGNHIGDFPNKTQAKLCSISKRGKFLISHITKDDDWFLITLIEPEEITLLKLSKEQIWSLNPTKHNGKEDYLVQASKSDLININAEVLDYTTYETTN